MCEFYIQDVVNVIDFHVWHYHEYCPYLYNVKPLFHIPIERHSIDLRSWSVGLFPMNGTLLISS